MANIFTRFIDPFFMKVVILPPTTRSPEVSYAPLVRIENATTEDNQPVTVEVPIGSFVPELYELACAGQLKCQIEFKEWIRAQREGEPSISLEALVARLREDNSALYDALYINDQPKTEFELALVPGVRAGVQARMENEYKFRRDRGLPLPPQISRFLIESNYLAKIHEAGLRWETLAGGKNNPAALRININNPTSKLTRREKILHYIGMWGSWLLTISSALTLGVTSPILFALCAVGIFYAKKGGNDFAMFDIAETLHRDIGWLTSKDFGWRGRRIQWRKTTESILYLLAMGVAGYFAITAAWAGAFSLPLWTPLIGLGLPLAPLALAQFVTASILAILAIAGVWAATIPIRTFWGISFWDNQIEVPRPIAQRIPALYRGSEGVINREAPVIVKKFEKESPAAQRRTLEKVGALHLQLLNRSNRDVVGVWKEMLKPVLVERLENQPEKEAAIALVKSFSRYLKEMCPPAVNDNTNVAATSVRLVRPPRV